MLKVIRNVFNRFEKEDIIYCHWKSNERLAEFLNGEEDLDLLFYPEDEERVHNALLSTGAKKFEALPVGKYENIKDYLALDADTGKLVHFHVHFGLDIGEKNVKRYRLPWTSEILENRIKHEDVDVYTSSYEHELLLLILREILRRPPHKIFLLKSRIQIKQDVKNEFEWLKKRIDRKKLLGYSDKLIPELSSVLSSIIENGITRNGILKNRRIIADFRKQVRNKSSFSSELVLLKYRFNNFAHKVLRKLKNYIPKKRITPMGGIVVLFIGSDGAGKSTTIENVYKVFSKKIDTVILYMGNPKPENSLFPFLIKAIKKLRLFLFWNLYVKKRNLKKAEKFIQKGGLVLLDRFPQSQYPGIMDGPMLSHWLESGNVLRRWISRYEKKCFKQIEKSSLDLLVKLHISAEESSSRGKLPNKRAEEKTKIVDTLALPNAKKMVVIDTEENSIEAVKQKVVEESWKMMPHKRIDFIG